MRQTLLRIFTGPNHKTVKQKVTPMPKPVHETAQRIGQHFIGLNYKILSDAELNQAQVIFRVLVYQ